MATRKRKCLSVSDKINIIESVETKTKTRKEFCDEYGIGLSSISKFINGLDPVIMDFLLMMKGLQTKSSIYSTTCRSTEENSSWLSKLTMPANATA